MREMIDVVLRVRIKGLEEILAQLAEPVSFDQVKELHRKAEIIALMTVPDEVKSVLDQIEDRYLKLIGLE